MKAKGADGNLIIHGDNLEALKALIPRYAGRVKCVYIDPPYNTGHEGWSYNDKVNSPLMQEWLKRNGQVDREDNGAPRQMAVHDVAALAASQGAARGGRGDLRVHRRQRAPSLADDDGRDIRRGELRRRVRLGGNGEE